MKLPTLLISSFTVGIMGGVALADMEDVPDWAQNLDCAKTLAEYSYDVCTDYRGTFEKNPDGGYSHVAFWRAGRLVDFPDVKRHW